MYYKSIGLKINFFAIALKIQIGGVLWLGGGRGGRCSADWNKRNNEETGYKNIKFVKQLGGVIHSKFWQDIKAKQIYDFTPLYFELQNSEQEEAIEEEQKKFYDMHWVAEKKF